MEASTEEYLEPCQTTLLVLFTKVVNTESYYFRKNFHL